MKRCIFIAMSALLVSLSQSATAATEDHYKLGSELAQSGKLDEAMSLANQMISKEPHDARGYKLRAEIYHRQGKDDLAQKDADKCMTLVSQELEGISQKDEGTTFRQRLQDKCRGAGRSRLGRAQAPPVNRKSTREGFAGATTDGKKATDPDQAQIDAAET